MVDENTIGQERPDMTDDEVALWELVENATIWGAIGEPKIVKYDSPEAIAAAGWRVD